MNDPQRTNTDPDPDTARLVAPRQRISYGDKTLIAPDYETNAFFPEPETSPVPPADTGTFPRGSIFAPGDIFLEKYEILRPIGAGGMGSVFQARHVRFPKLYAIKVINPNLMEDPTMIQRFEREARLMAEVGHRNAVTIFDFGVSDDICYLVMEYLKGETLRQRLRRAGTFDAAQLRSFAEQMCCVLGVMHRKKIIHRDLKPDNIYFHQDEDGEEVLKVLDFGIAKLGSTLGGPDMTVPGAVIGTPDYMSPEQCHGGTVDARSDLYALGIIFFHVLTGALPFDNDNPMTVMYRQVNEPAPNPCSFNPDIPAPVANVILKMLAKEPNRRYRNAHDVLEAIFEAYDSPPPPSIDTIAVTEPLTPLSTSAELETFPETEEEPPVEPLVETPIIAEIPVVRPPAPKPNRWLLPAVVAAVVTLGGFGVAFRTSLFPAPAVSKPEQPVPAGVPSDEFILIPGGEFTIGRNADECGKAPKEECNIQPEEIPAHPVTLAAYYIGRTEVTNRQYREFIAATGYAAPPDWLNGNFPKGTDDLPVTQVSWNDAEAYCRWRSQRDRLDIRLPTEAEWEHAARGDDNRRFPWGNDWKGGFADVATPQAKQPFSISAVSRFDKSPLGVSGMAGNVGEWTRSTFEVYPGSTYAATPGDRACLVVRGGNFRSKVNAARTSYRAWDIPTVRKPEYGFRLAATPPKSNTP